MKKLSMRALALLLALCMVLSLMPLTAMAEESGVIYVSDLECQEKEIGWGEGPLIDTSYYGKISLYTDNSGKRTEFDKGLVAHAASKLVYDIEGLGAVGFQSYVGVTDDGGSCGFYVYTDLSDAPLFSHACVMGTDVAPFVDVELPVGATKLILVTDGGNHNSTTNDHSAWADAKLILGGEADEVALDRTELTMEKYETVKLAATATKDGEVVPAAITWSSSDESVVSVRNGTLTAVGMGQAVITASVAAADGSRSTAQCAVTVLDCLYDLAEGWELRNGDDRQNWDILDEDTLEVLVQYGDMYVQGGTPRNTVKNLFLHDVEDSDFEITVRMDFKPDNNFESAGLLIYGGDNANFAFTRRYHTYFETRVLGTHGVNTDVFTETHQSDPSLTQAPIWLKLVKEDISISAYYSLDGQEWIAHEEYLLWNSFKGLEAEDLKVGLYLGDSLNNNNTTAAFSHFSIQYGENEAVECPFGAKNEMPVSGEAVENAMDLIDAIGTVTTDSAAAIEAARAAFEELNSAEKLEVLNIETLEEAEMEYIWLTLDIGDLAPFAGERIDLPVELEDGSRIYWETSDPDVVSENGIVYRGTGDASATLTATMLTPDGRQAQREFEVELEGDPYAGETEFTSILQIGDSNTEFGNMTQNMKDILNERHGDYGTGFMTLNISSFFGLKAPKNYSFAYAGAWTQHDTATGAASSSMDAEDSLNGLYVIGESDASMIVNFLGSEVDLYYMDQAGYGSFTVIIDGQEVGTVETDDDGDMTIDKATFDAGAYGKHEMIIYVNEGPVNLHGIDVITGQREKRTIINTWGNGAARTQDYARFNEEIFISGLQEVDPDKVVIALGTNDHGIGDFNQNPTPAAEFEEYLVTVIQRVQKALPEAEIWVMSTFDVSDSGSRQVSRDALHEYWRTSFPNAVERTGVNYWHMGDWFGEWDGVKMQDSCHCNGEYGRYMMEELYNNLFDYPMTTGELGAAIDAFAAANAADLARAEDLMARVEALNPLQLEDLGADRVEKLELDLQIAKQIAAGTASVLVAGKDGSVLNLSGIETAGLAMAQGVPGLRGWFSVDGTELGAVMTDSFTASASVYVASALATDPDQYQMIYSTGDHGTALRLERTSTGLRFGAFAYNGSSWNATQSAYLTEEQLDSWIDVTVTYDNGSDRLTLTVNGETTYVGLNNIAATDYDFGIGMCPEKFQRTSDLLIWNLHIFNTAMTQEEAAAAAADDETVALWYDFDQYNYNGLVFNPFTDVADDDYFYAPVLWAVENKITAGATPTTFEPEEGCTRAQVVTFLYRAAGEPQVEGENPFKDVDSGDYFYNAVLWAVSEGITKGTTETTFEPDEVCSRAQIVTFLYRYAGEPQVEGENPFIDVEADEYYYNAVLWASRNEITQGDGALNTFNPDGKCERCQIVTFLYRYMGE